MYPAHHSSGNLEFTISSVDYAPDELYEQTPFVLTLIRELPGKDRPDYWLAELRTPLRWLRFKEARLVTHLILAARWTNTKIEAGVETLPVGIAYVTDQSLLSDAQLDFSKCVYVAIGTAHDTSAGRQIVRNDNVLTGMVGRFFGTGTR